MDSFDDVFGDKARVLVVMGHPDDNEIICGGTVARLLAEGKKVRLVVCTTGGKGFKDRKDMTEAEYVKIRHRDQIAAGLALGLPESENFNLGIPDGELENSVENIGKIVRHIREFKPEIIITHNPFEIVNTFYDGSHWVNHRDHRHAAQLVVDAAYPYSRDRGFFPDHFKDGLTSHTVSELLFSDHFIDPAVSFFEITKYHDKKVAGLKAHIGALDAEEVAGMAEETKKENGHFESLKWVKIF